MAEASRVSETQQVAMREGLLPAIAINVVAAAFTAPPENIFF